MTVMTSSPAPAVPDLAVPDLAARVPDDPQDADALYDAFVGWAADRGLELYPAQQEALLELVTGAHVILSTPTGSGKSLVAMAAHFVALAQGRRTYYTAPLKALVSEKFFDLVRAFGPTNVGMMTGDSSVNPGAPIICCTAEILANIALRTGEGVAEAPDHDDDPAVPGEDAVGQVVMDEFHFYADPQRGWAWQVPLLELPRTQFLLMSATLGEVDFFVEDLERSTGTPVASVTSAERPVPLTFSYVVEPLHEVVEELVNTQRAPVYLVHFTQKDAVERAQGLLSTTLASRERRDAIAAELGDFRFGTGFGKTLSRLLRHGVGVHHAGMLPRYRRVVERLTQKGLLTVVCGTDTLGVGINVPIRTVVLTSLVKYDGTRMRHLSAREFHQIAGRAGRAGFDTVGEVLVMAPDHVIENRRMLEKAGDDPKKVRKIVRKKAPEGHVNWTDKTFERLRDAPPEPLTSSFAVSHATALNVLARQERGQDPVAAMRRLLTDNHEPESARGRHVRQAVRIYRSLRTAGVVERVRREDGAGWTVRLTVDLPADFALNQPLSPFALAALELLDREAPSYALDVLSVVEATLDDPRQVLVAQEKKARGEAIAAMKAEGYEYEERMAALEDVSYPRPLAELLEAGFSIYRRTNPWVADHELSPKSVVRDMVERGATFTEYVSLYGLERTEGVLLRYLADAFRALRQTVPPERRDEQLEDLVEWLGEVVRGTDSSLLDEWERLQNPEQVLQAADDGDAAPPRTALTVNRRAFRVLVRNALWRRVELVAREQWDALGALGDVDEDGAAWTADRWHAALDPYFDEHDDVGTGPDARGPALLMVTEHPAAGGRGERWAVRQVLDDPAGHRDWRIDAVVDLAASDERDEVALVVTAAGRL
jgi:superfamily II RNA helicase